MAENVCNFKTNRLPSIHRLKKFIGMGKVRNIIQTKGNAVFSVPSNITVYNALELMLEKSIGALLIVDNGKFVGIFTERDYARKLILKGKSSKETLIREVMTERPITVNLDTSIEDCMKIMSDKKIRHLPVMENEKLTGVISVGDVVKFIIEEQKFIIENLEQYITH
jgi:CBS domain-containing protein